MLRKGKLESWEVGKREGEELGRLGN